jgi:alpha-acetolactate decarboxylase
MRDWQKYHPKQGLSLQEVEGELVILDQARYKIHQLNPAASEVWRCIQATNSVDSVAAVAAILEIFDVDEVTAAADVEQALEQFVDLKLLVEDQPED